jgi:hypothetical protein
VILLLALALITGVVPVVVVVLVGGGVELLPLGAVGNEVGGVSTLETAPRRSPPLLMKPMQSSELSRRTRRGCSRTAHQNLHTRKTKQTPKQMS